jgi:hypothetical protein
MRPAAVRTPRGVFVSPANLERQIPMLRFSRACARLPGMILTAAACGCLALGCSGGSTGNRVSGAINFKGSPVPAGKIYFTPDASKGNSGQPGFADIKDGAYDTGQKGSQGVDGGAMAVRIEGFDAAGAMLFVHTESFDLPKGSATKNFDVPASAAEKAAKAPAVQP